jgi:hypothetical protein
VIVTGLSASLPYPPDTPSWENKVAERDMSRPRFAASDNRMVKLRLWQVPHQQTILIVLPDIGSNIGIHLIILCKSWASREIRSIEQNYFKYSAGLERYSVHDHMAQMNQLNLTKLVLLFITQCYLPARVPPMFTRYS